MNTKKSLKINVTTPCNQNWDDMTKAGAGRFCSNCQKVVVDFSGLSDQELYAYFSKSAAIPCGRFHNDQLNKIILARKKRKGGWAEFYKIAATILAFFSMKFSEASGTRSTVNTTVAPPLNIPGKEPNGDKVTITGVVTDEHGHLLENAQVRFGDSIVVSTDKEGRFKIEISLVGKMGPALLLFSYPGLVSTIRNYHPAMLSTAYNVILYFPHEAGPGSFTMGVPILNARDMPPTTIKFVNNSKTLSPEAKQSLSTLATWSKNNPDVTIKLMTYIKNKNYNNAARQVQSLVKKYLTEQEGIGEERIKIELLIVAGIPGNMIEIVGEDRARD